MEKDITPQKSKSQEQEEIIDELKQQLKIYQELQELQNEEIYKHYIVRCLQQISQRLEGLESLKGIGQALVNIGQIMEEKSKGTSRREEEDEDELPEDEEEEEDVPRKKRR